MTPSTISSRLMTVAKTGRLIERSDRLHVSRFAVGRRRRGGRAPTTFAPGRSLPVPSTTMRSPARDALQDFRLAVGARADLHVDLFDAAVGL